MALHYVIAESEQTQLAWSGVISADDLDELFSVLVGSLGSQIRLHYNAVFTHPKDRDFLSEELAPEFFVPVRTATSFRALIDRCIRYGRAIGDEMLTEEIDLERLLPSKPEIVECVETSGDAQEITCNMRGVQDLMNYGFGEGIRQTVEERWRSRRRLA